LNRAQVFSLDLVIAFLVFIGILLSSFVIGDYTTENLEQREIRTELELASIYALSALIETPGVPANWSSDPSNLTSLGISKNNSYSLTFDGPWVIDEKKIFSLNESNYNQTKSSLGLDAYNFSVTLNTYNGSEYTFNYSLGANVSGDEVLQLRRYALLNGDWAEVILKVSLLG